MARQRYVCRKDKAGNPIMVRLDERMVYLPDETVENFSKRILKSYYDIECKEGSRFRPDYGYQSVGAIKEAWTRGDRNA